jgi:hypothetical protein
MAVLSAALMCCAGTVLSLHFGKSSSQAISNGAVAALAGLGGWFAYHLVSRRNNGLINVSFYVGAVTREDRQFLSALTFFLIISVLMGWFIGVTACVLEKKEPSSGPNGPLYDAQLDHPA